MKRMVSVIVPCYNQEHYIVDALNSVLNQTYENWECIVVNDGSSDCSETRIEEFCHKDIRFRYFYQENKGVASARNFAIQQAVGELILPLDGDDMISSDYIEKAVAVFAADTSVTLVYCNAELFGEERGKWELPPYDYQRMFFEGQIFCSAFYKKEDFIKTSGYNPNMVYGWEDWDFLLDLLNENSVVVKLDCIGFFYRRQNGSRDKSYTQKQADFLYKQVFLNHQDKYLKLINPVQDHINMRRYKNGVQKYKLLFNVMLAVSVSLLITCLFVFTYL